MTLDEALLSECVAAWITTNAFITRLDKAVETKQFCKLPTVDQILREHGITWENERTREAYYAYERAARKAAYLSGKVSDPRRPSRWSPSTEEEREAIRARFAEGLTWKQIAKETGRSYQFVRLVCQATDSEEAA